MCSHPAVHHLNCKHSQVKLARQEHVPLHMYICVQLDRPLVIPFEEEDAKHGKNVEITFQLHTSYIHIFLTLVLYIYMYTIHNVQCTIMYIDYM